MRILIYTLYIFNDESRRLERYRLENYMNMPYTTHNAMTVSDFFAHTASYIGWTSSGFLEKWSQFSKGEVRPSFVFRRVFEGGHIAGSMHYAGLAADMNCNHSSDIFPFSEPKHIALSPAGFPEIHPGDIGLFVLVFQDALAALGFTDGELDGFFGHKTLKAFRDFKSAYGIDGNDFCDTATWKKLTFHATGCGVSENVKYLIKHKIIF